MLSPNAPPRCLPTADGGFTILFDLGGIGVVQDRLFCLFEQVQPGQAVRGKETENEGQQQPDHKVQEQELGLERSDQDQGEEKCAENRQALRFHVWPESLVLAVGDVFAQNSREGQVQAHPGKREGRQ